MTVLKRFILMLQFLTTIPIPLNLNVNNKDFGKGLVFAPLVGFIIGAVLTFFYFAMHRLFPVQISVILVIIVYIIITGGLHLDGLGDTCDGIFSNRPKERILEIMRDSRVGTNAVLAIVSVILLDAVILISMREKNMHDALLLMPVAGRIGSLVGAGCSVYARSTEGLGKSFIDFCGFREILEGLLLCVPLFLLVAGLKALLLMFIAAATAFLLTKYFSRKIGGATGDILGAVCEINQTLFLVLFYVMF